MNQNRIGIIGCGWLGLPLAKTLILNNYKVKGSTTTKNKLEILKKEGIEPYLIEITKNSISESIKSFLNELDILIINIPPKIRKNSEVNYSNKIQNIINKTSKIKNILFISSTSVYGSKQGKISSKTIAEPDSRNGTEILKTENLVKSENNTIIRFGGLISEDRNPLKYLIQKNEILNPDAPINYIHLKDCIGIISKVIFENKWGKTYSAVAPFHPTKKEYYDNLCEINNIKKLNFSNKKTVINKEVNDNKILSELKYDFKYPTL
jgi:nucleoside-diphosphate-sugar epimerase